ncbi:3-demethylubiquinone-9 3-methyltransferase [Fulvivirga imtechensis AK7]|uniref:3-demethylubiquinone-9 3-methyltransferase n=1 Tax=Fulvivirga imtechensis AK7 TaxID=1237149 RepID=L8JU69_9BACT|nr:VOC family protein [Fulvivirga imtechensis]ELR71099.1 3-demethylubiquinone-9 3-methyltransferase [Fulvivirga imtechensis AK7]
MKNLIYPCLWFDGNASEAASFYCATFRNSKVVSDTPIVVNFEMKGQKFMALNGGTQFKPNPSISFMVACETADEIEGAWEKLTEGGKVLMPLDKYDWSEKYGWVQDRFGVSWQLSLGNTVDQKFIPSLMFTQDKAGKAEEAIHFYTSVFDNASVDHLYKYTAEDQDTEGMVKHAQFTLRKQPFTAMDSSLSHQFSFSEGVSLVVECKDQQEIDHYWNKLTEEGEESMCGWLKDKYGVSWQIIPAVLEHYMNDQKKAQKVTEAFLKMRKFDIEQLEEAYERG